MLGSEDDSTLDKAMSQADGMHKAARDGKCPELRVFLQKGSKMVSRPDDFGFTPLHFAARQGKDTHSVSFSECRSATADLDPMTTTTYLRPKCYAAPA